MNDLGIESALTVVPHAPHPFLVEQIWFDLMLDKGNELLKANLK